MRARQRLAGVTLLATLASGCTLDKGPVGPLSTAFDRAAEESSVPLVLHLVAPQVTDPAIDRFLDAHYVWLDTTAQSQHRLLVFMPGTGQRPAQFQLIEQEAARLGFHVIGLEYVNSGGLAKVCPLAPDPTACFEDARLEIIDGVDRTTIVNVTPTNSIDNRLAKLLGYLAINYPDEGWAQFLDEEGGSKWPLIAVSGLSVGGGEAAMIARVRLVDRVLMFSAVPDSIGDESVSWVGSPHVTPVNRYYGLVHDRDAFFPVFQAAWDSLGLAVFGPAVAVETSEAPYGWTHELYTDLTPVGGFIGQAAHASTATDAATPLAPDGTPLLRNAWRYMLTASPRRPGAGAAIAVARE